jgi:hypothetical protein
MKRPDDNDALRAGALPLDPEEGTARVGAASTSGAPAAAGGASDGEVAQDDGGRVRAADLVVSAVKPHVELFRDVGRVPYATARGGGGRPETVKLRSRAFRSHIGHLAYRQYRRTFGSQAIEEARDALEAIALHDGEVRDVHLRVARVGGAIYVDLADEGSHVVEVTAAGWRVIDDPPVRFLRPSAMRALPFPEQGGSVRELRPFVRVAHEESFVLVVAWLVAAFNVGRPCPVLVFRGEQGTSKSTTAAIVRRLVDPNKSPLRSPPRTADDLAVAAQHSFVVAFDNLSNVRRDLSDDLCRLCTGGGLSKRKLYEDDEEVVLEATRPILLNGIPDLAESADLAERSMVVTLAIIPEEERRPLVEVNAAFERVAPRVLGALLDGVASALAGEGAVRLARLPRMADFMTWATAAESGLGLPSGACDGAYRGALALAVEATLEADPVASAVRTLLSDRAFGGEWKGTATNLLRILAPLVDDEVRRSTRWPKDAARLGSAIRRAASFLRRVGIEVAEANGPGHSRLLVLRQKQEHKGELLPPR